jgi:hypothetical protein
LATIQELGSSIQQGTNIGDSKWISIYAQRILPTIDKSNILETNIKEVYRISEEIIKKDYPKFYFPTFYQLNMKLNESLIFDKPKCDLILSIGGNDKKRKININFKPNDDLAKEIYGDHLSKCVFCEDIQTDYIDLEKGMLQDIIIRHLSDTLVDLIGNKYYISAEEKKNKPKIKYNLHQSLIGQIQPILRQNFNRINPFQQLPWEGYPEKNNSNLNSEQKEKEWFVDFVYKLRNILFHAIIDPFDPEWCEIVKYSYLGLHELLEENIKILKKE